MIPAEAVDRFRGDFEKLTGGLPAKLGIAVSGGPDSLALLLLGAAAYPGRVCAATVDHGLRPESASEARFVGEICIGLDVPHDILPPVWGEVPRANVPAGARGGRYRALSEWSVRRSLDWIATGHHVDDQAETFLMRAARGSGVAGLAGVRGVNSFAGTSSGKIVRPLLGWRKTELLGLVASAGLVPVDDPTNDSDDLDRTHARRLLASTPWLNADRLAAAAAHLSEAEDAIGWAAEWVAGQRLKKAPDGASVVIDPRDLPRELQRRLLLSALSYFTDVSAIPGPKLITLLNSLHAGRTSTLADAMVEAGETWRVTLAPARTS